MFSTSILMFIFTLVPFSIFVALCVLEVAVNLIQTFVFFLLLLSSYLKDAIELN